MDGAPVELHTADGAFTASGSGEETVVDLGGRLILPGLAEPHAHLDKALLADRFPNPGGDLIGAIEVMRAGWMTIDEHDVASRATETIRRLVASGVTFIRTHVDTNTFAGTTAISGLVAAREACEELCDIELVAMGYPLTGPEGDDGKATLDRAIELGADALGGVPHIEDSPQAALAHVLHLAKETGLPVDLHMDEVLDPSVDGLTELASEVIRHGLQGRVTASHCVIAAALAEAGVAVVTLPRTNLYLQARDVQQAPPRGTAGVEALLAEGVEVAGGGDNVQDPFSIIGQCDPLEAASLLVVVCHRTPEEALDMVTHAARRLAHRDPVTFEPGTPADFVAIEAGSIREAIAERPPGRTVVHRGRVVAETRVERRVID